MNFEIRYQNRRTNLMHLGATRRSKPLPCTAARADRAVVASRHESGKQNDQIHSDYTVNSECHGCQEALLRYSEVLQRRSFGLWHRAGLTEATNATPTIICGEVTSWWGEKNT